MQRATYAIALAVAIGVHWMPAIGQTSQRSSGELDARGVYLSVRESVVTVDAKAGDGRAVQGSGVAYRSGFNAEGSPSITWIATNAHVVGNAKEVRVSIGAAQGKAFVEYVDDDLDLAILRAEGLSAKAAWIATGKAGPAVGDRVYAVGAPFGLEHTITEGIYSGRRDRNGVSVLQSSAAISSGNSGGGLFNTRGRLIGITTFKIKGGENLSFAIDAAYVDQAADALLASELLLNAVKHFGTFDASQRANLVESRLTKWFLTPGAAGGAHHVSIVNQVTAKNETEVRAYVRKVLAVAEDFLQTSRQPTTDRQPELVRLTCQQMKGANGDPLPEVVLTIDYQRSTVNGKPANITEGEVTWGSGEDRLRLNRYTGSFSVGSAKFPVLFSGTCSRAQERKF